MMAEQLLLVSPRVAERPSPVRCRMCSRAASWLPSRRVFALYCAGGKCDNQDRLCRDCGGPYRVNEDGATHVRCATCVPGVRDRSPRATPCAWCGGPRPAGDHRLRSGKWPYICQKCLAPIWHLTDRLKSHNVDHRRARRLLDDFGCEVCGRDVVTKIRVSGGKVRSLLVVDHDHMCCPGQYSCGRCVRGFLCGDCNSAAGMLGSDATRIQRLAKYIEAWPGEA